VIEAAGFGDEAHPGCAAGVDHGVGRGEEPQGEDALAEVEPDALDRVELGL
jgi:hypothetical protein